MVLHAMEKTKIGNGELRPKYLKGISHREVGRT